MALKYPKKLMTKSELMEIGIPEAVIERAIHHKYRNEYAQKTGKGRTCKWIFDTGEFEEYRKQGAFQ